MKITIAVSRATIDNLWVERGVITPPTVTVEMPDAEVPADIRAAYRDDINIAGQSITYDGRLVYKDDSLSSDPNPVTTDTLDITPAMAIDIVRHHMAALAAHKAKEEADKKQWEADAEARRKAEAKELAEKKRVRDTYDKERAAWIKSHGSPRLKKLLAEGIALDDTYRKERLAIEFPGFVPEDDICGGLTTIRDASEAALAALDEARAVVPSAKLAWLADKGHLDDCVHYPEDAAVETEEFIPGPCIVADFFGMQVVKVI